MVVNSLDLQWTKALFVRAASTSHISGSEVRVIVLEVYDSMHLEDHVKQHVEAGFAGVAVSNVGRSQVKQIAPHLSTDCLQQHLLPHSTGTSDH